MTASDNAAFPLIIHCFGPMRVFVEGTPLPRLRSRKALWLLALLTLRHGRAVEREWLAGTLWPDMDQSQASTSLRPVLSELRQALGAQGARVQSPSRQTLLLDLEGAQADVVIFDAAIAGRRLPALEQAVHLYQGALLEGCAEEWVYQERALRERGCLHALQTLAEHALTAGDYEGAANLYRRAIEIDPMWDTAQRGLMEALAQAGDSNAALQVYRKFVDLLRSDPKALPDEKTSALYAKLRREVRQRAISPLEPKAAPPPRLINGALPHALTELIGREDERADVAAKLRRARLVTLTGLGGIGKTRLAIEVARDVLPEYPDGVWLASLESISDGKLVCARIAAVLDLQEEQNRTMLESLTDHLRRKRLLLVLDNCEHVLAACVQVAAHLLRECANVRILATSRESLGLTGEAAWTVPSLATPDPDHLPQGRSALVRVLMGYESVRLFVERAQAAQQSFSLTGTNAMTMARVSSLLEGIPLAIELAASRVNAMTIEQIEARLHDHRGLLTGGSRTALSRQQTLRSTLDWSYGLLGDQDRLLLARVSVFAGGWTLEAAEAVCSGHGIASEQIQDLLISLVEKSLVAFTDQPEDAGGRYRLLEMVRQYAAGKRDALGETEAIKDRHTDWFLALAEAAEPELRGAEQGQWLRRVESEHDNLRAALARIADDPQATETDLRLSGALWRFWYVRGYYREGRRNLERALARPASHIFPSARAKGLWGAGNLAYSQGEHTLARGIYEEALGIYRALGDQQGVAKILFNLANVAHYQGEADAAQASYHEALAISRALDDKVGIATALIPLGHAAQRQGDYALARSYFEECLGIRRELRDSMGLAALLEDLGNLNYAQGHYDAAWSLHDEALEIRRSLGYKRAISSSLSALGLTARARDEDELARALFAESLEIRRELGDKPAIASTLARIAEMEVSSGDYGAAQALYEESEELYRQSGFRLDAAAALCGLGDVSRLQGDAVTAWARYADSLKIFRDLPAPDNAVSSLRGMAAVAQAQAYPAKAVRLWGAIDSAKAPAFTEMPPRDREEHDRMVASARIALGEETFASLWREGAVLSWEEVMDYALEKPDPPSAASHNAISPL
ncbi:hypothetical protein CCAX7_25000 [Capsulimonas corticalis]|uniref:Uncharacterized protein n=1 Tax=Capsulimonas corticalis TaxID=2219043 RepID=A0A402CVL0_9BACT|nr:tetratricopeptide repeat protein [Capsulimonas corticalis]BDI30449.1 hypothetical protein CCAX7_25000 [Capsulimonas corticalis]